MRRVIGYSQGKTLWSENVEGANPGSQKIGGYLVVGVSQAQLDRASAKKPKTKEKAA